MTETSSLRKMCIGLVFFALTVVAAVIGYTVVEGWSIIDSIYMVVITIFGVGYGEVHPIDTVELKVFTTLIIIAGCSSGIYVVGGFVQMIAEGEINRALGARRMSRGIEQSSNHVIICGFGRVGRMLAFELKEVEKPFVCVDANPDRIAEAEQLGYMVVFGNAGEEETLIKAGIHRACVLATVLPDDAENVFITLTARELTQEIEIIARGESTATQRKLIRSGANHVVLPASIGATQIANMISCPTADTLISDVKQRTRLNSDMQSLGLTLREVHVDQHSGVSGCRLSDIQSDGQESLIVAIQSIDGKIRRNPASTETIQAGDILYILSSNENSLDLVRKVESNRPEMTYRGAKM